MKTETIHCPQCGHGINLDKMVDKRLSERVQHEIAERSKSLKIAYDEKQSELDKDREHLENSKREFQQQIDIAVKSRITSEKTIMEQKVRREVSEEMEVYKDELLVKTNQVKDLNRTKAELERVTREKEELREAIQAESELKFTTALREERAKIEELAEEKSKLKLLEREHLIESLNAKLQDAQRQLKQGSMQLQGEVQELALEDFLRNTFPLDSVEEIKKGARGADCLHTVNSRGRIGCGTLYYESKRTKEFQAAWIEKFKGDMRAKNADIGVIITDVMPKDMSHFGLKDGIWIATFQEFRALVHALRETILLVSNTAAVQENRGEKMELLFQYLIGNEFRRNIEAIVEGFVSMQSDLETERRAMESIWKKRQKQIDKVLLNTSHMYSSVRGIAGSSVQQIKSLELPIDEVSEDANKNGKTESRFKNRNR